jgi:hypothetical protein
MNNNLIQNLEFFSNQIQDLEFYLDSKWASTYSDHRLNIRRHLYKKTKVKAVLDLQQIPKLENKFVSISHCPILGGFALCNQTIGLDLEQKQRLSLSLIQRVSDTDEIQMFPEDSVQALWTIKESVYKCSQRLDKNMVSVEIKSNEKLVLNSAKGLFFKSESEFSNQKYLTYTWLSNEEDLCLSLSTKLK